MLKPIARSLLFPLIPLLLAGTGCNPGQPGPTGSAASNSPATTSSPAPASSQPVVVLTASGVEMVHLPGGQFDMGSDRGNPDEGPRHPVRLTPFLIDRYEVTQEQFAKAQLPNPSHWNDNPKRPVERVRWRDAKVYCNERSALEGLQPCYNEKTPDWTCNFSATGYRLPTEAEWEFAARAGSRDDFEFGGRDKLRSFSWYEENAGAMTHPVGQKKPNKWGIHDMYGNVSEWCEDVFDPGYYKTSPQDDPAGPPSPGKDVLRVMRGGSWKSSADMCRVSFRQGQHTGDTDACFYTDYCGFRCVRRISAEDLARLKRITP